MQITSTNRQKGNKAVTRAQTHWPDKIVLDDIPLRGAVFFTSEFPISTQSSNFRMDQTIPATCLIWTRQI